MEKRSVKNALWRFLSSFADLFLLSVCWYVCCIPVVTVGAGTTAMYYVALRLTKDQEEDTLRSFLRSFRANFRQATLIWLGTLVLAGLAAADLWWALFSGSSWGLYLVASFGLLGLLLAMTASFLFPLLARVDAPLRELVKLGLSLTMKHPLSTLAPILITAGMVVTGIFVFWPLLLVTPGVSAYLNALFYGRVLEKHGLVRREE